MRLRNAARAPPPSIQVLLHLTSAARLHSTVVVVVVAADGAFRPEASRKAAAVTSAAKNVASSTPIAPAHRRVARLGLPGSRPGFEDHLRLGYERNQTTVGLDARLPHHRTAATV